MIQLQTPFVSQDLFCKIEVVEGDRNERRDQAEF